MFRSRIYSCTRALVFYFFIFTDKLSFIKKIKYLVLLKVYVPNRALVKLIVNV
jgi:hypothetical protein